MIISDHIAKEFVIINEKKLAEHIIGDRGKGRRQRHLPILSSAEQIANLGKIFYRILVLPLQFRYIVVNWLNNLKFCLIFFHDLSEFSKCLDKFNDLFEITSLELLCYI